MRRSAAGGTDGPVCHQVQQQTASVCVPSFRCESLGGGHSEPVLQKSTSYSPPYQCGQQDSQSEGDHHSSGLAQHALVLGCVGVHHSSGLAQHALVLGCVGVVVPESVVPANPAVQQKPAQGSAEFEPPFLALPAKAIREQGFSDQVAENIEASQRRSTRYVYETKWSVFVQWCKSNQIEQIADFLLHLFKEKTLQPSTIDGYSSAIADKEGNCY